MNICLKHVYIYLFICSYTHMGQSKTHTLLYHSDFKLSICHHEKVLNVLLLASGPRVSGFREISSSLMTNNIVVELVWCEQFSIEMHTKQFYLNE